MVASWPSSSSAGAGKHQRPGRLTGGAESARMWVRWLHQAGLERALGGSAEETVRQDLAGAQHPALLFPWWKGRAGGGHGDGTARPDLPGSPAPDRAQG